MGVENILIICNICGYTLAALGFIFANEGAMRKNKGVFAFVAMNVLNMSICIALCTYLYQLNFQFGIKILFLILIFNTCIVLLMLTRSHISSHYYNNILISKGKLEKIIASTYLKTVTVPHNCTEISKGAISDFPYLTQVYFGKNITHFSDEAISNCPNLKILYFQNPNIVYDKVLDTKYKIVISKTQQVRS